MVLQKRHFSKTSYSICEFQNNSKIWNFEKINFVDKFKWIATTKFFWASCSSYWNLKIVKLFHRWNRFATTSFFKNKLFNFWISEQFKKFDKQFGSRKAFFSEKINQAKKTLKCFKLFYTWNRFARNLIFSKQSIRVLKLWKKSNYSINSKVFWLLSFFEQTSRAIETQKLSSYSIKGIVLRKLRFLYKIFFFWIFKIFQNVW